MMDDNTRKVSALLELERRGQLPASLRPALDELRRRGIAPKLESARPPSLLGSESLGAGMISAGRTVESMKGGAQDLYARATGDDAMRADIAQQQAEADRLISPLEQEFPKSTTLGGGLPYMALPIGAAAGVTGRAVGAVPGLAATGAKVAASPLADAVLGGAALGGLDYKGSATGGALGGLGGNLLGRAVGRAVSPMRNRNVGTARSDLAERGKRLGFQLTPAQVTGSRGGEILEESMKSFAPTAGAFSRRADANQATAARIALNAVGESGEEISDEVLGRAANRIGSMFEDTVKDAQVRLDDDFLSALAKVEKKYSGSWGEGNKLANVVDDALDAASKGPLTGKEYAHITSRLGKAARQKLRGENADPDAAFALFGVKEALDDAMERSLGIEARETFRQAREQYRNLMFLESPGVVNSSAGTISLPTLANVLKRKDKPGFLRGKNQSPLYEAARVGQAFKPSFGTSGTTERFSLPAIAGGAGTAAVLADPVTALAVGAGIPLSLRGGAEAYNALTSYLTNQAMTPARRKLIQGLMGQGGAGVSGGLLSNPTGSVGLLSGTPVP